MRRRLKKIVLWVAVIVMIVNYAINYFGTQKAAQDISVTNINTPGHFLPRSTTGVIIAHNGYTLSYSEAHEQAEWVAYTLNKNDIVNTNRKRPYFIIDPKVPTASAHWRSYKNSGYDRGHLCPAGDRKLTRALFDETFYTSNISPQRHDFNAGIWNTLEQKVRWWATKYNSLYVITGGVLKQGGLATIGADKVSVPQYFYKIVVSYDNSKLKAIAFLLPHKDSNTPLYQFVVSIDRLEELTGIDFFEHLPETIEAAIERSTDYHDWAFR